MNLTALLIPSLVNQLAAVAGWLDKAEAFAAEQGTSPDDLLPLRLAPDMLPLATQLRFLAFQAQEPRYRLSAEPVSDSVLQVRHEGRDGSDHPGTWDQARSRIAEASAALAAVSPAAFDEAADTPLAHDLPMGMIFDMTGETYVRDWALPQCAFHQVITYAILRQAGVPLGKVDFVPHMFGYLRPGTMPGA